MITPVTSVVVAVKDDHRIYRTVDSLLRQTVPANRYEVIVVENGSARFTDLAARASNLTYLRLPNPNSAAARNAGLAAARGRFLLLTDADCVADPEWIETMTAVLESRPASIVGGCIKPFEAATWVQMHAITIVGGQTKPSYLPALHRPYVAGANAGFDTDALRAAGGFDETLLSGNDVDVCYKLGLAGHAVTIAPAAIVHHHDRATLLAHFQRFRFYAIYQVLLFAKYREHSGKKFVFDRYPFTRTLDALRNIPKALATLACGDSRPALIVYLQLVEAAGVFAGDIEGAIRFRQFYI